MCKQLKCLSLLVLQSSPAWLETRDIDRGCRVGSSSSSNSLSKPLGGAQHNQCSPAVWKPGSREGGQSLNSEEDIHVVGSSPDGPTKGIGTQSDKKDICTKVGEGCRAVVAGGDWLHAAIDKKNSI